MRIMSLIRNIRLVRNPFIATIHNVRISGDNPNKVIVKFKNAPYHENQFFGLRQTLEREYPGTTVEGEATPNDCFEVIINARLVHSKLNGDGFIDAAIKKRKISDAMENKMEKEKIFA